MIYVIAALLVLIADQGLKYFVTLNIPVGEGIIPMIPKLLDLVHYRNTGAAFSMMSGGSARWAFVLLAACFTLGVTYALMKGRVKNKYIRWSLVMVAAGAIGNAIDRALYGYVVDMFKTPFKMFGIFNIADIFIVLGGIALCVFIILMPGEKIISKEKQEDNAKKKPGFKLFSEKRKLPEETAHRRRTGRLYGDPRPFDGKDPLAEFEEMPAVLTEEKDELTAEDVVKAIREEEEAERVAKELQEEISLESILAECSDEYEADDGSI